MFRSQLFVTSGLTMSSLSVKSLAGHWIHEQLNTPILIRGMKVTFIESKDEYRLEVKKVKGSKGKLEEIECYGYRFVPEKSSENLAFWESVDDSSDTATWKLVSPESGLTVVDGANILNAKRERRPAPILDPIVPEKKKSEKSAKPKTPKSDAQISSLESAPVNPIETQASSDASVTPPDVHTPSNFLNENDKENQIVPAAPKKRGRKRKVIIEGGDEPTIKEESEKKKLKKSKDVVQESSTTIVEYNPVVFKSLEEINEELKSVDFLPKSKTLPLFHQLNKMKLTLDQMRATLIGFTIKKYTRHEDPFVVDFANKLVDKWKKQAYNEFRKQ
jgi:TFIIS helical bundle-like domain